MLVPKVLQDTQHLGVFLNLYEGLANKRACHAKSSW
jgi:hypothetical protein